MTAFVIGVAAGWVLRVYMSRASRAPRLDDILEAEYERSQAIERLIAESQGLEP